MDVKRLEAFAAVMASGSVTAAGRVLGRSQPVVTRLIRELETEIGYELFARNGPRLTPTEQGLLFFEEVERTLLGLKQLQQRAAEIAHGHGKSLRLAATPALSANLIPQALMAIEDQVRPSHVSIQSLPPERVVHAILTGAAQLGVTSLPFEQDALTTHWLGQAPCMALVAEHDPLAAEPVIRASMLSGRRLISVSNPYRLRRQLDGVLKSTSFLETNSSINVVTAVRAGLGVAVMEPVTAYGLTLPGVVIRPLDVDIQFGFGVISARSTLHTAELQQLTEALRQAAIALLPAFSELPP